MKKRLISWSNYRVPVYKSKKNQNAVNAREFTLILTMILITLDNFIKKPIIFCKEQLPPIVNMPACGRKMQTQPLQEQLVQKWMNVTGKGKMKAIGSIYSTIFDLMYNTDQNTKDVLYYNQKIFTYYIECDYFPSDITPKSLNKHMEEGRSRLHFIYHNYPGLEMYSNEIFYQNHGLRKLPYEVLQYLRNRDFIDAGAYQGDSMIILQNYTDQHIYGYEPEPYNYHKLEANIENWKFNKTKNIYMNKGLGEEPGLYTAEGGEKIPITTIDNEAEKHNITVGFIKGDTEGMSWSIIKGAKKTIIRDRPVICIHLYHNYDEYVGIPQFIRELGNYLWFYRADNFNYGAMMETAIIAYPAEIIYPRYSN